MAAEDGLARNSLAEDFFKIPRELRDLIYADVYDDPTPIPLQHVDEDPARLILSSMEGTSTHKAFAPEIVEAFYTYNTFSVDFMEILFCTLTKPVNWGPHPQYQKHIQRLIVHANEADPSPPPVEKHGRLAFLDNPVTAEWERLLSFTQLEHLTVRLQKRDNTFFNWVNFSPVLVELRTRRPKLEVALHISFDLMLKHCWSDPYWDRYLEPGATPKPYEPMGFVDVTELIEAPTEEDFAYVQEHLAGERETLCRDIARGLLDETASQRRALALHYVVKEPALLRVRMLEHYDVYKRLRAAQAA